MMPLMSLLHFKDSIITRRQSHSWLVDIYQIYIRNVLLFCFGLSIARQVFGETISCHVDRSIPVQYVELRCFINGTITSHMIDDKQKILYHDYYQWVSVLLLLLAFNFYFPFRFWSRICGKYLDEICKKIDDIETCNSVLDTIQLSNGNYIFWKMWALECYYALHTALTLIYLDFFFNNAWSTFGYVFTTVYKTFPIHGTCQFSFYSDGGDGMNSVTCLLPLNIVYRKVFIVLLGITYLMIVLHMLFFMYRILLVIRFGRKFLDVWWSMTITKHAITTWRVKQHLESEWKRMLNNNWKCETLRYNDLIKFQESIM